MHWAEESEKPSSLLTKTDNQRQNWRKPANRTKLQNRKTAILKAKTGKPNQKLAKSAKPKIPTSPLEKFCEIGRFLRRHNANNTRIVRPVISVIFCFIFGIKAGNCLYIVSAFVCRTTTRHKWCRNQDIPEEKRWNFQLKASYKHGRLGQRNFDQEKTDVSEQEQHLEKKLKKEIDKFKFYLEGDELLKTTITVWWRLRAKRTQAAQTLNTINTWH